MKQNEKIVTQYVDNIVKNDPRTPENRSIVQE